ncbi:protein bric-a-brac 1-like isoform X9 [Amphibalanus amphitrite]|uniref:protein bric-a-brac 1-like isoform X12 n=1 Tax=Amphibalanus amphitrite TaxID=1232801 RepID=UPI001C90645C|nr:protein bric-a-brac 1-like isoform X12 [Amphibalanus amphitrite]XP_043198755.1 protein bric-a-brac 1-like isoform X9 [Amphibalanus amphitrite]
MDEGQNFCLQWNSYQTSVTSLFNDLRRDGELVDVTLCAQGQQIKVHRMMLSACSPYFRDVLKGNLGTHPVFFMRDISFKDLSNIVEFMYRGKVNVAQSELGSFLKTAETLQVRGLTGDDEPAQPEPPKKTKTSTPSAPPPPRLSPEPPRHRAAPQPPPPPPPPPLAAAPPSKRPLSPPPTSSGEHALLTPKRPRSVDQPAPAAAPEAALPRPGSEPLSVKEEPLVLEDGDDSYHGGGGENSSGSGGVMPLLGDSDAPHMGFLTGTPTHPQAHEFQDEDLLAAVAGPSGFPSQDLSDSSTPAAAGGLGGGDGAPAAFPCRYCGALFNRKPNLRRHEQIRHEGRQPVTCPVCGRSYTRSDNLKIHMRTVHQMRDV